MALQCVAGQTYFSGANDGMPSGVGQLLQNCSR